MTTDRIRAKLAQTMQNDEFCSAMERFAESFEDYRSQLPVIPYAYSRTRLLVTPRYEIIAMLWSPGSTSPIHDHGNSRCWVLMMEGSLGVENYERDDKPGASPVKLRYAGLATLQRGDVDCRFGPLELHRVFNTASDSAFSLQLYAGPIAHYTIVDVHSLEGRVVDAICDLDITLG